MKQKIKLGIILGVEFVAITVILILIFFAGKKSYNVTFDLNGGTLISGDLEQVVMQGKNATPPVVAKDGCYLHSWSASYRQITRDIVIKAVWEWQTSIGFDYTSSEDSNYCEIVGCFKDLTGDVYVGVYHDNKKVLGIRDEAFRNRDGITYIHMLDGILSIGESVFRDCDSLIALELPGTLTKLGKYAFMDCKMLEKIVLPGTLEIIPESAFEGCTSLKEVVIPSGVKTIESSAFAGCTSLEEIVIPSSVEVIKTDAFKDCTSLKKITFEVDEEIELEEGDEPIDTPNEEPGDDFADEPKIVYSGLLEIETKAFNNCPELVEVILPITVEKIGENAFNNELLTIKTPIAEKDKPEGWDDNWCTAKLVEWEYVETVPEEEKSEKDGWFS